MRALLDTNAFLWAISRSDRLSSAARTFMADFNNELLLSVASLWEIAIKTSIGKLELLQPFDQLISAQLEKNAIDMLPIKTEHLSTLVDLEFHHKDPFDRLIIAQGLTEQTPVITSDAMFCKYPVNVIW